MTLIGGFKCETGIIQMRVVGGLGYQLFGLCLVISESLRQEVPFVVKDNTHHFKDVYALRLFDIEPDVLYSTSMTKGTLNIFRQDSKHIFCKRVKYFETKFSYLPIPQISHFHLELQGYFQSFRYFLYGSSAIRNWLQNKLGTDKGNTKGIVLHVRLGDMARNPVMNAIHGLVDRDYIESALSSFSEYQGQGLKPLIVTDDIPSLASLFPELMNECTATSNDMVSDFKTLCSAQNIIISNSTFSWWAAWIGNGCVVAPKKWFADNSVMGFMQRDFFPESWKLI